MAEAFSNPAPLVRSFTGTARGAIDEGADVIIPAEGVLSEFLYRQGISMIEKVPVMDVFGVAWSYAAMIVGLRAKTRSEIDAFRARARRKAAARLEPGKDLQRGRGPKGAISSVCIYELGY